MYNLDSASSRVYRVQQIDCSADEKTSRILIVIAEIFHIAIRINSLCYVYANSCRI